MLMAMTTSVVLYQPCPALLACHVESVSNASPPSSVSISLVASLVPTPNCASCQHMETNLDSTGSSVCSAVGVTGGLHATLEALNAENSTHIVETVLDADNSTQCIWSVVGARGYDIQ